MTTLRLCFRHALWLALLLPLLASTAASGAVALHLAADDVAAMEIGESTVWMKLTPSAASRLRAVTEQSYGQRLEIDLEGVPLLQTDVFATIESGVLQVNNPSAEVIRRLERLQQQRSGK